MARQVHFGTTPDVDDPPIVKGKELIPSKFTRPKVTSDEPPVIVQPGSQVQHAVPAEIPVPMSVSSRLTTRQVTGGTPIGVAEPLSNQLVYQLIFGAAALWLVSTVLQRR